MDSRSSSITHPINNKHTPSLLMEEDLLLLLWGEEEELVEEGGGNHFSKHQLRNMKIMSTLR